MPNNGCCDTHVGALPVQHRELPLFEFAGDDDLRQKPYPHPCINTLFNGFDAGEFRDILRSYIRRDQLRVEHLAISTAGLGEE